MASNASEFVVKSVFQQTPEFMKLHPWENFDTYTTWQLWMQENWNYSVYMVFLYVLLIYVSREWMKLKKEPYKLKLPLFLWNAALALFSIIGFCRTYPELINVLSEEDGFHKSCCIKDRMSIGTVYWTLLMTLSKVVELGDTAFIVLRKQPLIFLHWYHHATVLLYTWYTYSDHEPSHRWFMTINLFVHSLMYSYYACRALGYRFPRPFAMMITSLQIIQMVVGVTVNVYSLNAINTGKKCQSAVFNIYLALAMYATYFILFSNFFYKTYFVSKRFLKEKTQ